MFSQLIFLALGSILTMIVAAYTSTPTLDSDLERSIEADRPSTRLDRSLEGESDDRGRAYVSEPASSPVTLEERSEEEVTGIRVEYRTASYTVRHPNGQSYTYENDMPYVVSAQGEVDVFKDASVRVDHHLVSDSGRYIYFSAGSGKDAAVRPYVYDVRNEELSSVCFGETCQYGPGFAAHSFITVSWLAGDRLEIVYDDPGLPPGATEWDPAIGLRTFRSVEGNPAMIIEEYDY